MNARTFLVALAASVALLANASAVDRIKTAEKGTVSGAIQSIGPQEVEIRMGGNKTEKIPANQIVSITFDGEETKLSQGRNAALNGRYEDALTFLKEAEGPTKAKGNEHMTLDLQYFTAFCTAQLALGGSEDVPKAGKLMRDFVNSAPESYHIYRAHELLGDLYLAVGQYEAASKSYDAVAAAPWTDYKMRAHVAKGRALQANEDYSGAQKEYQAAIALAKEGEGDAQVEAQRLAAVLGTAECMAESNEFDKAIEVVEGVIKSADPENAVLHARAYNTLGACYRKGNRPKDALLAFLHVDLLYYAHAESHARALKNLAELWTQVDKPERAIQAQQLLKDRYANSRWAQ
jgi:tetratricopeptide (TPR) repeat protein